MDCLVEEAKKAPLQCPYPTYYPMLHVWGEALGQTMLRQVLQRVLKATRVKGHFSGLCPPMSAIFAVFEVGGKRVGLGATPCMHDSVFSTLECQI